MRTTSFQPRAAQFGTKMKGKFTKDADVGFSWNQHAFLSNLRVGESSIIFRRGFDQANCEAPCISGVCLSKKERQNNLETSEVARNFGARGGASRRDEQMFFKSNQTEAEFNWAACEQAEKNSTAHFALFWEKCTNAREPWDRVLREREKPRKWKENKETRINQKKLKIQTARERSMDMSAWRIYKKALLTRTGNQAKSLQKSRDLFVGKIVSGPVRLHGQAHQKLVVLQHLLVESVFSLLLGFVKTQAGLWSENVAAFISSLSSDRDTSDKEKHKNSQSFTDKNRRQKWHVFFVSKLQNTRLCM